MCLQLCGDPYVTTLTHRRGFTAQEQYVVPKLSHSIPKVREFINKEADSDRKYRLQFQNSSTTGYLSFD